MVENRGAQRNRSKRWIFKQVTLLMAGTALLAAVPPGQAALIAEWTFETSVPEDSGPHGPEVGAGSAAANTGGTISNPVGNGSAESLSSTAWNVGDHFQFTVSTRGYAGIEVSWDQVSSDTGPRDFALLYSVDGITFLDSGMSYEVKAISWSSTSGSSTSSQSGDLSGIPVLNNQENVYFRLQVTSSVSAKGETIGSGGTSRVDNFKVEAIAVPEPATWLVAALLVLPLGVQGVRRLRLKR